ncbi:transposase [Olsenella sp. Marseille-P4559]|uniref:transposase n=1 Tax=Olsenella sp. Marseille-P4559 TaxID=2364795 RepID=UPI00102FEEB7
MPKGKPRPAELKARVAVEVMHGEKTINEIASEHDLNTGLVRKWVAKAESEMACVSTCPRTSGRASGEFAKHREEVDDLRRKLGEAFPSDEEPGDTLPEPSLERRCHSQQRPEVGLLLRGVRGPAGLPGASGRAWTARLAGSTTSSWRGGSGASRTAA